MTDIIFASSSFFPDYGPGAIRGYHIVQQCTELYSLKVKVITIKNSRYKRTPRKYMLDDFLRSNNKIDYYGTTPPVFLKLLGKLNWIFVYFIYVFKISMEIFRFNGKFILYSTSSGFMAYYVIIISSLTKKKICIDYRDQFILSLISTIKINSVRRFLSLIWLKFEGTLLSFADELNFVSGGFGRSLGLKATRKGSAVTYFENGSRWPAKYKITSGDPEITLIRVLYVGNIGYAQGLELFIPMLAENSDKRYRFTVVGTGRHSDLLAREVERRGLGNVELVGLVEPTEVTRYYQDADILLLSLNANAAFENAIPSKIYEYLQTSLPIMAIVSGYAKEHLSKVAEGVFTPESRNPAHIINTLHSIDHRERFSRSHIETSLLLDEQVKKYVGYLLAE
jgi:hypothetical protein